MIAYNVVVFPSAISPGAPRIESESVAHGVRHVMQYTFSFSFPSLYPRARWTAQIKYVCVSLRSAWQRH